MKTGRPKAELKLSEAEEAQLSSMARSRSMPAALTQRARIVLACASGEANKAIAGRMAINKSTVGKWRGRFVKHRISGLYDEIRPGPPRTIDDERVAGLIQKTLHQKPKDGSTHWSVRRAAAETGISITTNNTKSVRAFSPEAYDYYVRGLQSLYENSEDSTDEGLADFQHAPLHRTSVCGSRRWRSNGSALYL